MSQKTGVMPHCSTEAMSETQVSGGTMHFARARAARGGP